MSSRPHIRPPYHAATTRLDRPTICDKCDARGPDNAYRMTHASCGGIFR